MKGGSGDDAEEPAATEGEAAESLYAAEGTGAGGAGKTELADGDGDVTPKTGGESPGAVGTLFNDLTKHINLVVVLIVVSIPEGLPLTI